MKDIISINFAFDIITLDYNTDKTEIWTQFPVRYMVDGLKLIYFFIYACVASIASLAAFFFKLA